MEMRFQMPSCRLRVDHHRDTGHCPEKGGQLAATVIALAIRTRPTQSPVAFRPRASVRRTFGSEGFDAVAAPAPPMPPLGDEALMSKISERQLELAESCRQHTSLSLKELWICCLALGSTNTLLQLEAFLHGALRPTPHEYNLMAVAVNEHFADVGLDQFVPYVEDAFAT